MGLNILIAEDGRSQRELLRDFLEEQGHAVAAAEDGERAVDHVKENFTDLMLLDYKMPGMDGMAVLRAVKSLNPEIDVIMMTAYGTIDTAVDAMKAGAADYIAKPVDLDELLLQIDRIAERRTLVKENEILRRDIKDRGVTPDRIIFRSPVMEKAVNLAGRVADSNASVLIQGETGAGKELLARLIHHASPRAEKPLITVNCAALAESLLESELFGHEKGAFTGADRRRIGRFEEADGGSLFLDEIGELSQGVQVKLLRFLQEKEFQRVGGNQSRRADVRIISATNRDLSAEIKTGGFREDLYYRLNVVTISAPPLRERKEDIPPLIDHFIARFSQENRKPVEGVDPRARDLLLKYDYPGNIRELENIIERAVVITRGTRITPADLPFSDAAPGPAPTERKPDVQPLKDAVAAVEQDMIRAALARTGGHQTRAAGLLGISERMLRYKLKKYGMKS